MTSQTLRNLTAALCFVVVTIMVSVLGYRINRLLITLDTKASVLLTTATSATQQASAIARQFKEEAQEPEAVIHRRNLYRAGTQTVGILTRFERDTLPRIEQLAAAGAHTAEQGRVLIANTDRSINEKLLPESTAFVASLNDTAKRLNTSTETLTTALEVVAEKAQINLDDLHGLLSDPLWRQSLLNVEKFTAESAKTAQNVTVTTASISKAMDSAPNIAQQLEKIATTSSKYQKITLLVSILATIARAF